jgi:septum formation protein
MAFAELVFTVTIVAFEDAWSYFDLHFFDPLVPKGYGLRMAVPRLVLASSSPRRAELLKALGLRFEVIPSRIEERHAAGEPHSYALRMACQKALAVARKLQDRERVVLGADTVVTIDGRILGKPTDVEDACGMLRQLSARRHSVVTAFSLVRPPEELLHSEAVETEVEFKRLSEREIAGYVATGEPMDKAGSYGAQGLGMFLLRQIRGSYANVVGLPVCEVVEALDRLGIASLFCDASGG